MNGPNCMYKMRPIIQFPEPLDLPSTIYPMKNIYSSSSPTKDHGSGDLPNILEQVNKVLKNQSSKVELLKARQEKIILQLNDLKHQVLYLKDQLHMENSCQQVKSNTKMALNPSWNYLMEKLTSYKKITSCAGILFCLKGVNLNWSRYLNGVIHEVVVHASPNFPPYSLLAINQLWPEVLRVQVSCHTHSSIVSLPTNLSAFSDLKNTPSPTLNVRLVWKNMGADCELVISPLSICKLRGEVNLLRYLHRTICSPSDLITETKMDSLLDLCHSLSHSHTVRDKQLVLRALNARLGKSHWLNGNDITIVDLAAWSALKNISGVDLSQHLSKWQTRLCEHVLPLKEVQA